MQLAAAEIAIKALCMNIIYNSRRDAIRITRGAAHRTRVNGDGVTLLEH